MSERPSIGRIKAELRELASPVAADLQRAAARTAALRSAGLVGAVLAVPVAYLVLVVFAGWVGVAGVDLRLPFAAILLLAMVPPVVLVLVRYLRAVRVRPDERRALVAIDRELDLQDRLSAAHEFAGEREPDGFRLLAIHDAARCIERARAARDGLAHTARPVPARRLLGAVVAAVALLVVAQVLPIAPPSAQPVEPAGQTAVAEAADDANSESREPPPAPDAPRPAQANRRGQQDGDGTSTAGDDESPAEAERKGQNPIGAGRSAEARTAHGSGSERGQPSNQAQSTKGDQAKKPRQRRREAARRDEREAAQTAKQPPDPSGATQGQGSGKGSSKSPTASPWSAKDQVVTDEEQDPDEDEEVDDENDESKARGGVQPNLRQRKPPVNRDLQIAMGNGQPPDDANGRGGPGGPKKQRGVAQLVLGVTFPDHVSAQPNPGISKITQERIEPQTQMADAIAGEDRGQRAQPMGPLSRRILSPWMRELVRTFYLSLREQGEPQ